MAPFEGIGKESRELAKNFHEFRAEADKLLTTLKQPFVVLLDEIAKEAGVTLKRRSTTAVYAGSTVKLEGMGVMISFTPEQFLCLSVTAYPSCYGKVGKEALAKFTADRGYTMTNVVLSKAVQLPEANSKEEIAAQVSQGANFLRDEIRAWEELLKG
jgi:hypothetical protein